MFNDPLGLCWGPSWVCSAASSIGGGIESIGVSIWNGAENVSQEVDHAVIDVASDAFYLPYWAALDANGAIHWGLGSLLGRAGCDIANVFGAALVPIQAVGLGGDAGLDWVKEHVLGLQGYTVGDEGNSNLKLFGDWPLGFLPWHHNFPGIDGNGTIDWWW